MQVGLLPVLRRTLRLPRLEYTSIMNQGDFLIEVPSDRKDIPRVCCCAAHLRGGGKVSDWPLCIPIGRACCLSAWSLNQTFKLCRTVKQSTKRYIQT